MDGGATPCPSPLLWPRAPLTQCREVQAVKGERPLAVPVGCGSLAIVDLGPKALFWSLRPQMPVEWDQEKRGRVSAPQRRSGGAEKRGGVLNSVGKEQAVRCTHTSLSLSVSLSLSAACLQTSSRAPPLLSGVTTCITSCVAASAVPPYYHVLPFPHCYTASDLRPAETTRRT